jgi:hypothetical protein
MTANTLHTQTAKTAHISGAVWKKTQPGSSRSGFSLLYIDLDLDLEKKHPNHGKERRLGFESENQPLVVPPSTNPRAKPLPLENGHFLGF